MTAANNQFQNTQPTVIRWLRVANTEATPIPPFGAMEMVGVNSDLNILVRAPTVSNRTDVLFNGPAAIPENDFGQGQMTYPVIAAYQPEEVGGADPIDGSTEWGVQAGSYYLQFGQIGYRVVGGSGAGLTNVVPVTSGLGCWAKITAQDTTPVLNSTSIQLGSNTVTVATSETVPFTTGTAVTLANFTTAALNGSATVTSTPGTHSFTFALTHADIGLTSDTTGLATPVQQGTLACAWSECDPAPDGSLTITTGGRSGTFTPYLPGPFAALNSAFNVDDASFTTLPTYVWLRPGVDHGTTADTLGVQGQEWLFWWVQGASGGGAAPGGPTHAIQTNGGSSTFYGDGSFTYSPGLVSLENGSVSLNFGSLVTEEGTLATSRGQVESNLGDVSATVLASVMTPGDPSGGGTVGYEGYLADVSTSDSPAFLVGLAGLAYGETVAGTYYTSAAFFSADSRGSEDQSIVILGSTATGLFADTPFHNALYIEREGTGYVNTRAYLLTGEGSDSTTQYAVKLKRFVLSGPQELRLLGYQFGVDLRGTNVAYAINGTGGESGTDPAGNVFTGGILTTLGSTIPSPVVASNNLTGQTAAVSSVATYTPGADGIYRVGGYVTITAVSLDVLQLQCTYTDETSTTRTQTFFPQGLTSASLATTGAFIFPTMTLRAKSGSAITLLTALITGTGSIAYDVGGTIEQLA